MLSVYTVTEAEKWDSAVRSFAEFDVYWLSGYVKAFKIHGDGEPLLFYWNDGETRGINVVMKRDVSNDIHFTGKIKEGQYFDFATPYGYGGWLIEGKNSGKLFEDYEKWCQKNGIISEFVRFHPMLQNQVKCENHYLVVQLGEVVHMELGSPDIIWKNIISKNRNVIRKAVKNGVQIYHGRYPEIYEKFQIIYNKTMDRDRAEDYYYFGKDFYISILEELPENAQVFYAEKDGVVIAASIILAANGMMDYHLSGSIREYSSLAPTNLLLYKAALWGCANGYRTLYLGGGIGSREDSLFKFKRSFFKGDLNRFHIGKKIFMKEGYTALMNLRTDKISDEKYFPLYRA